jgi:hypothetical protein
MLVHIVLYRLVRTAGKCTLYCAGLVHSGLYRLAHKVMYGLIHTVLYM